MYACKNKPQTEMTADPTKYPQGYFKDKKCRNCGTVFTPKAPSHLMCSQSCADRSIQSAYLRRNYNIQVDQYEDMLRRQGHRCAVCQGEGFTMAAHHKVKLVVDHCHKTGRVRGLLCHNCNRALGLMQDDVEALKRSVQYLEGATTIPQGSTLK